VRCQLACTNRSINSGFPQTESVMRWKRNWHRKVPSPEPPRPLPSAAAGGTSRSHCTTGSRALPGRPWLRMRLVQKCDRGKAPHGQTVCAHSTGCSCTVRQGRSGPSCAGMCASGCTFNCRRHMLASASQEWPWYCCHGSSRALCCTGQCPL